MESISKEPYAARDLGAWPRKGTQPKVDITESEETKQCIAKAVIFMKI